MQIYRKKNKMYASPLDSEIEYYGIVNLGQSCYISTALHLLSLNVTSVLHIHENKKMLPFISFLEYIDGDKSKKINAKEVLESIPVVFPNYRLNEPNDPSAFIQAFLDFGFDRKDKDIMASDIKGSLVDFYVNKKGNNPLYYLSNYAEIFQECENGHEYFQIARIPYFSCVILPHYKIKGKIIFIPFFEGQQIYEYNFVLLSLFTLSRVIDIIKSQTDCNNLKTLNIELMIVMTTESVIYRSSDFRNLTIGQIDEEYYNGKPFVLILTATNYNEFYGSTIPQQSLFLIKYHNKEQDKISYLTAPSDVSDDNLSDLIKLKLFNQEIRNEELKQMASKDYKNLIRRIDALDHKLPFNMKITVRKSLIVGIKVTANVNTDIKIVSENINNIRFSKNWYLNNIYRCTLSQIDPLDCYCKAKCKNRQLLLSNNRQITVFISRLVQDHTNSNTKFIDTGIEGVNELKHINAKGYIRYISQKNHYIIYKCINNEWLEFDDEQIRIVDHNKIPIDEATIITYF